MKTGKNFGINIFFIITMILILGLLFYNFDIKYKSNNGIQSASVFNNTIPNRELNEGPNFRGVNKLTCNFNGNLMSQILNKDPCGDFERGNDCCSQFSSFKVLGKECC